MCATLVLSPSQSLAVGYLSHVDLVSRSAQSLHILHCNIGSTAVLLRLSTTLCSANFSADILLFCHMYCCCHEPPFSCQAGGCYVPLDPTFPADRLSIYLEDSQAVALITQHSNATLAESLIADLPCRPQVHAGFIKPSSLI